MCPAETTLHPHMQGSGSQLILCMLPCCLFGSHLFHQPQWMRTLQLVLSICCLQKLPVHSCMSSASAYLGACLACCVFLHQARESCRTVCLLCPALQQRYGGHHATGLGIADTGKRLSRLVHLCTHTAISGSNMCRHQVSFCSDTTKKPSYRRRYDPPADLKQRDEL